MGAVGDEEAVAPLDALRLERGSLLVEGVEVDGHAVAEQVLGVRVDEAAGQQVEGELLAIHHHGVASVGASVEAGNDVIAAREGAQRFRRGEIREARSGDPRRLAALLVQHCSSVPSGVRSLLGQDIGQLALALVAPLAAEDGADARVEARHRCRHGAGTCEKRPTG